MGQNVHAVLLGVKVGVPPEKYQDNDDEGGDGWQGFVDDAEIAVANAGHVGSMPVFAWDESSGNLDGTSLVGAWIAVGRYGDNEVPGLDTPIQLDKMVEDDRYKSAIMAAERSFAIVREWALAQGVDLGEPTLWLTTTSVR